MPIEIISKNAEDKLFSFLVSQDYLSGKSKIPASQYYLCQFFHAGLKPHPEDFSELLAPVLKSVDATLYAFKDGDILISWTGKSNWTEEKVRETLQNEYEAEVKDFLSFDNFLVPYDILTGRSELKALCQKKLGKKSKSDVKLSHYFSDPALITTLEKTIGLISMQRNTRREPSFLLVEDQIFSQKLVQNALKDYTVHVASTVSEALAIYLEKCPDILLLDIELPDVNGHSFARLINRIDSASFIVMVSSNLYIDDVEQARENNAVKFIAKPFKKDEMLQLVDLFKKRKKQKKSIGK